MANHSRGPKSSTSSQNPNNWKRTEPPFVLPYFRNKFRNSICHWIAKTLLYPTALSSHREICSPQKIWPIIAGDLNPPLLPKIQTIGSEQNLHLFSLILEINFAIPYAIG